MSLFQRIKDEKFKSTITRDQKLHDALDILLMELDTKLGHENVSKVSDEVVVEVIQNCIQTAKDGIAYLDSLELAEEEKAIPLAHYELIISTYTALMIPLS